MKKIAPKLIIFLIVTPICLILDQITKIAVLGQFRLGESKALVNNFFSLTHVHNTGAAFGILSNADPAFRIPFFIIVPLLALVTIGWFFKKIPPTEIRIACAFSLVIGGAVGNLIDRIRLGFVVDFILVHYKDVWHFPAFNVADSTICIGVGLLLLDLLGKENAHAPPVT